MQIIRLLRVHGVGKKIRVPPNGDAKTKSTQSACRVEAIAPSTLIRIKATANEQEFRCIPVANRRIHRHSYHPGTGSSAGLVRHFIRPAGPVSCRHVEKYTRPFFALEVNSICGPLHGTQALHIQSTFLVLGSDRGASQTHRRIFCKIPHHAVRQGRNCC